MSQITLIVSSPDGLAVKRFADKTEANDFAGKASAVKGAEVLQLTRPDQLKGFGEKRLAELYNLTLAKGDAPLKRMQKTPSTFTRVYEALTANGAPRLALVKDAKTKTGEHEVPAVKKGKKTAKAEGGVTRPRSSPLAGKKLHKLTDTNPRRAGSHGAKSWEAYRSGTLYETAVANGARPRDIWWDVMVGKHVKAE